MNPYYAKDNMSLLRVLIIRHISIIITRGELKISLIVKKIDPAQS